MRPLCMNTCPQVFSPLVDSSQYRFDADCARLFSTGPVPAGSAETLFRWDGKFIEVYDNYYKLAIVPKLLLLMLGFFFETQRRCIVLCV